MTITAKELAAKLGLSPTAVSMALNNRPGVSTETRNRIIEEAERSGYDFSSHPLCRTQSDMIYFIAYRAYDTVLNYNGIFYEMFDGMEQECKKKRYKIRMLHVNSTKEDIDRTVEDLRVLPVAGIILLGTTIPRNVCVQFLSIGAPVVLIDNHINNIDCSSVVIDNQQGAYLATEYLINTRKSQPGYIRSTLPLNNFEERMIGFRNAIRDNGLSPSKSIIHQVSPSVEGAFTDMLEILENGDELADCYFADNDLIAIGVMKALNLRGIKIPEKVGIIGFDNIPICNVIQPALSSISISRKFMGQVAAKQLLFQIEESHFHPIKIEVSTKLAKRFSV